MNISSANETKSSGDGTDIRRPSDAFYESMRMAEKERSKHVNDRIRLLDEERQQKKVGKKTFIAAVLMVALGLSLFITGLVTYASSKRGAEHNGLEILVIGSVLLLPGAYACNIMYGYLKRWRGYDIDQLPSYD